MRDDLGGRGPEDDIARRVVAVMMRVDEEVDLALRHVLQVAERDCRRVLKLRIDDDDAVGRHEHADGAAAAAEHADVAAQRIERGLRRLRAAVWRERAARSVREQPRTSRKSHGD